MSDDTPSPFLSGTNIQYAFDSTSLGDFKKCPRYYQYTMIEGWRSRDEDIHLRFGSEYHAALHDYELAKAEGLDHNDAVESTMFTLLSRIGDWDPDTTSRVGQKKNKHSLARVVIWYLDKFKDDPAKTMVVNGKPGLEVSFRWELDYGPATKKEHSVWTNNSAKPVVDIQVTQPYILCGHLDRVVSFHDETYVMDRKTTTFYLGDQYFSQFEPNNQMTLYALSSQVVLASPIRGVIIDAVTLNNPDEPKFQRAFTFRTPDQLVEWTVDLKRWLAYAEECATSAYWPMNETGCMAYGGCKFRDVCSASPGVRQRFLEADFVQLPETEKWNPLRSR